MAKKITVYAPTADANVKKQRVAAYCRVSTDSSDQRLSYDAQKIYFQRLLQNSTEYELVDIYADLGISGTKYERPEFMRMLDDARCGKIDRVMCKSISRFARNTRDCLTALRELKKLGITVKFEKEGIDTARVTDEIMITIMEGLAQEESRSISNNIRWSLQKRMAAGTLKVARVPYGYEKDEQGALIIDEVKAEVVRRIYCLYLSGLGARKIAITLNDDHIPSPTGTLWNNITIFKILNQEKYLGDILWQKTYSIFMGAHDQINRGNVDSYYIRDVHPAIIDRDTFIKVQELREKSSRMAKRPDVINPFKGKVRCRCGRSCYLIKGKRPYWECTGRFDLLNPCDNTTFYNDELMATWRRFSTKLRAHADEILAPILIQLEKMEETVSSGEMKDLLEQDNDIRQRRYVLHKLCTEGCITFDKLMASENELEAELKEISDRIDKLNNNKDDTEEQVEMIYRAATTALPEGLIYLILEKAEADGKEITFRLNGGLYFKEVL